ncbi:MAG: DUF167 domain-containing protein [Clostridia bacterium]|nr:DUF167 domain-containing protein [Clostridia bacterium]
MFYRVTPRGIELKIRVQPRASKNEVAGLYGEFLKVRVTASPTEGQANEACRRILADLLNVPISRVRIIKGHSARNKTLEVKGLKEEQWLSLTLPGIESYNGSGR